MRFIDEAPSGWISTSQHRHGHQTFEMCSCVPHRLVPSLPSFCCLPEPLVQGPYRQLPSFILYIHALPTMRLCPLTMHVGASHSRPRTNRSLEQLPKVRVVRLVIKTQRATVLEVCHKLDWEAIAQELNRRPNFTCSLRNLFFSCILPHFSFLVAAFRPCHSRLPQRTYFST